jgi:putative peptidoglycan lipid II flippase
MKETQESYGPVFRAGLVIFTLLLGDKVLAVVKEMLMAQRYGISPTLDAFNFAYALPGITILIVGGASASAFVPLYLEWQGRLPQVVVQHRTLTVLYSSWVFFAALTAIGYLSAPYVVPLAGYGLDPAQKRLGVQLERLLVFLILFDGLGIILQALLHARRKFFSLYLAPIFTNVCIIVLLIFGRGLGIYALVYGFLLGSLCRLVSIVITLNVGGFALFSRPRFERSALSGFLLLVLPLLGSELIANSNLLIDQVMATQLPVGALSTLRYAFRVNDLPIQLVIISVSKSILPFICEESLSGHQERLRAIYRHAIIFIGAFCFPISALVLLFSQEIVSLLFQRGAFGVEATVETAKTLACYNIGLFFYAYAFINAAFFAALRNTKPLLYMGVLTLVLNIVNNIIFMRLMGISGIALSTTVTVGIISTLFIGLLKKKLEITAMVQVWKNLGLVAGAAVCMLGLGWALTRAALLLDISKWLYFPVISMLATAFYLGLIYFLRTAELDRLFLSLWDAVRPLLSFSRAHHS